jgi:5-methylcytosine-specific restriction endonuclease McrA
VPPQEELSHFVRTNLTKLQVRALVAAVSAKRGRQVILARDYTVWAEAESYLRALPDAIAARYIAALRERQRRNQPLIRPDLVEAARARPTASRPRYAGPPRSGDELDEALRRRARAAFFKAHARNRKTKRYARLRARRLKIAGYRCETCRSTQRLQLHHLHYDTLGRETVESVRILCDTCHVEATGHQAAVRRARWRWGRRGPTLHG